MFKSLSPHSAKMILEDRTVWMPKQSYQNSQESLTQVAGQEMSQDLRRPARVVRTGRGVSSPGRRTKMTGAQGRLRMNRAGPHLAEGSRQTAGTTRRPSGAGPAPSGPGTSLGVVHRTGGVRGPRAGVVPSRGITNGTRQRGRNRGEARLSRGAAPIQAGPLGTPQNVRVPTMTIINPHLPRGAAPRGRRTKTLSIGTWRSSSRSSGRWRKAPQSALSRLRRGKRTGASGWSGPQPSRPALTRVWP